MSDLSRSPLSHPKKFSLNPRKGGFDRSSPFVLIPSHAHLTSLEFQNRPAIPTKPVPSPNFIIPPALSKSALLTSLPRAVEAASSLTKWDDVERSKSFGAAPLVRKESLGGRNEDGLKAKGKERARSEERGREPKLVERRREDDLTVVEDLKMGPREFGKDPAGLDLWETIEPNTGIRLTFVRPLLFYSTLKDPIDFFFFFFFFSLSKANERTHTTLSKRTSPTDTTCPLHSSTRSSDSPETARSTTSPSTETLSSSPSSPNRLD